MTTTPERAMPAISRPSILPQLSVRGGRAAIEFYKHAFGAVEEYRVGGTDDHEAVVAQLSVKGATFWVADGSPAHADYSPESLGGASSYVVPSIRQPVLLGLPDLGRTGSKEMGMRIVRDIEGGSK